MIESAPTMRSLPFENRHHLARVAKLIPTLKGTLFKILIAEYFYVKRYSASQDGGFVR